MAQKRLQKNKKEKEKEKIVRPKRKPRPKDKPNYVDRKEFQFEMESYYSSDTISPKLGEFISKIAHGLSFAPNFINYSYKEEMIGDALVKMVAALEHKKFNIDSGHNPFSYFTTIAFHAFINRIKKEKKHRQTVVDYQDMVYDDMMSAMGVDGTATENPGSEDDG